MRFDRHVLLLAYTFASESAHGLVIQQDIGTSHRRCTGSSSWRGANFVIAASTRSSSANLVLHPVSSLSLNVRPPRHLSDQDWLLRDPATAAIKRERALNEPRADTASTTNPGLVVPAFRLPSTSGQPASLVGVSTTPSPSARASTTMSTENALSILNSALPSSVRSSLASEASSLVSEVFHSASQQASAQATSTPASTSQTTRSHTPTTIHISTSSHTLTTSHLSTSSTTSHTALLHPTPDHSQSPTPTPGSDPAHPIPQAAIAGIASGIGAAAIIGLLAGFYIWRRKRQGRPLFGPRGSQRSGASDGIYPKSAWLYDPVITPAHSRAPSEAGSEAEQNLLPNPVRDSRPLSEEIEADLGMPSPSFRTNRASSPLLPVQEIPAIEITGEDDGPYSSPEGSPYHGGRRSRPGMF